MSVNKKIMAYPVYINETPNAMGRDFPIRTGYQIRWRPEVMMYKKNTITYETNVSLKYEPIL